MDCDPMKHKRLTCLILAFIIVFSVCSVTTRFIKAANPPVLSVVLSGTTNTYSIPAEATGSTFKVDVRVDDISGVSPGVNSASYSLTWNPTVLNCIKEADNSWLPSQSDLGDLPLGTASGVATIGQISFDSSNPLACTTTPNVSATFTFQVISAGSCVIGLEPSSNGVPYLTYPDAASESGSDPVIGTTTINATYGLSGSSVHGPTANFIPVTGSTFQMGTMITLDASSSQPGYDAKNCPITNFAWSVEYLNGTTFAAFTGETVTFNASAVGTFWIILIVTANDTQASPNPSYVNTSSVSAQINVVSNTQSTKINITTDRGGMGPGASGGDYGPLQIVRMYAAVTSQSFPLQDENVIFSIQNSKGVTIVTRQASTNQTGIASSYFRLPSSNPTTPQYDFGTWSITASVDFLDTSVNDSITFSFNYLSGIENVTIPATIHRSETLPIQLTINNQYISSQWTKLTVTLFDQAGVPIGSTTIATTQQAQNISVIDTAITIPSWAFTGQATAYLCLLTNATAGQYTPIAPETAARFQILP